MVMGGRPGLAKIKDVAEACGLRPTCRYCAYFLGNWCEITDATQIADGVCLDWRANPDPPPLLDAEFVDLPLFRHRPSPKAPTAAPEAPKKPKKVGLPRDQVRVRRLPFIMPDWGRWRNQMHVPYHGKRKGRMK